MRKILFVFIISGGVAACTGGAGKGKDAGKDSKASGGDAVTQLIDTAALKSDMNNVLSGIASGKMDTNSLKKAAKDYLSTSQKVLSDSGIDQLYGNSNDPAVKAAAETLKKFRNASGLTPDKLDSLKKAAELLKVN